MLRLQSTACGLVELARLPDVLPVRVDAGLLGPWTPGWWRPPLRLQWARGDGEGCTLIVPFIERSIVSVRRPTAMLDELDLLTVLDRRALRFLTPWESADGLGFRVPDAEREAAGEAWGLIADRSRSR